MRNYLSLLTQIGIITQLDVSFHVFPFIHYNLTDLNNYIVKLEPPPLARFNDVDTLIQFSQKWAKGHGYALTKKNYHQGKNVYLECDQYGEYIRLEGPTQRQPTTKEFGCKFRLRGSIPSPIEEFAKEQEELTKKRKENEAKESTHQPKELNIIQAKKNGISTAIAKIEDWGIWQPPTISSAIDPFLNNYGLRNTKQRSSRNEQPSQEQTKSSPKTMETPLKKKSQIPGAYIDDEHGTVEKTIIPTKFKKLQEFKEEEGVIHEVKEKTGFWKESGIDSKYH
ncbi:hypothetical protein O181_048817 [Austropuccinia psidii MF-1]|uniref:Uncharacterized protein n=1 Tax=Austropuccinia psidii MF-1 TaxID=1389203 RepID=A0A9Q3E0K9_9BASI|nr:hypothetical protein [Austropuccinia psidii MF-1]